MIASTTSVATVVLSHLSSYALSLAAYTVALLMVVWMTRHRPPSRERRFAITALSLLLASKIVQVCSAGVATWTFAEHRDLDVAFQAHRFRYQLDVYLIPLLESVSLLMLAWVMVQLLRTQVLKQR